ncbi:ADP-ribosylglycohydrolase family protein [Fimbriiglobus ruber]|uniref:ADP-ribosylglycohydrolase family protein n=1 Tax=Fimbriiglobus ruber TaxID=1908690 RepID=A0A225DMQ1_9BACT|nr:ADP-ribosylglycohydrolase family protein [Fimbriiglobus ruber]OWK38509.1 ADP-ribosylglycohydrolase family protein [Fimbriiglobus ruber]
MTTLDRYRGCLLGLAAGDALGTTLEFKSPGTFAPIDDIVGGGPFRLGPGQWTDDTSMALCLAESLIERNGFDPVHQLETYCKWYQHGHLSPNGRCFDIGNTVRAALNTFLQSRREYPGPTHPDCAGNGSIMRLAPVPLLWANQPEQAVFYAAQSSRTTHGARECIDACRYFAGLIVGALHGRTKDELLAPLFSPVPELWEKAPLAAKITEIALGSFKLSEPPEIRGTGYVVKSLEAALWAFHKSADFRHGALLAVNLGDDADTTGAVYGQIAGAYYGAAGIPAGWREKLALRELIEARADTLFERAGKLAPPPGQ